ncbi:MAG: trimeric intracellular cation channel family protein [Clostridia bacterium]|nr:trimeric intracellular cation channel family protein [Clostridia bacterium]
MLFIDLMDIIGTAAFAVSGVLVGIKNRLDLFGVFVLAILTASGGGLIRDIIISNDLPVFFTQPKYLVTITAAMIVTSIAYKFLDRIYFIIKVFDAIGLGVFTILAGYKGILHDMPLIGLVFVAALTGIGGGILRDILVNDVPLVFRSEIYALASILGALSFYFLYRLIDVNLNVYLCIFVIFIIRMVSIHYNLSLPVIKDRNEQ